MTQEEIRQLATQGPVIVFIDEIDSLAPSRTQGSANGGSQEYNQTLTELLTALQGALGHKNITVIGATNLARSHFDPAFLRRFTQVLVPAPDARARHDIADVHIQAYNVTHRARAYIHEYLINLQVPGDETSSRTHGWTGSTIRDFIHSASECAHQDGQMRIQRKHMETAYEIYLQNEQNADLHQAAAPAPRNPAAGYEPQVLAAPAPGAAPAPVDEQRAGVMEPVAPQPAGAPEPVAAQA